MSMENLIFRGRPDDKNECEQWSLVRDPDDTEDYVVQEHVRLDQVLSGRPYMRLVKAHDGGRVSKHRAACGGQAQVAIHSRRKKYHQGVELTKGKRTKGSF
jgi:hypothetical protein